MIPQLNEPGLNLKLQQLSAGYEGDDENAPTEVFTSINLSFSSGKIHGIAGPNGCGKSTLLSIISGLKNEKEGTLSWEGDRSIDLEIGFVPQDFRQSFYPWMSVKNNLRLVAKDNDSYLERAAELAESMSIKFDPNLTPSQCSGGMLQQVALVRSLINKPNVLLLDEPFSALDSRIVTNIRSLVSSIVAKEDILCLCILHSLDDLVDLCDDVLLIGGLPFSTEKTLGHFPAEVIQNRITQEVKLQPNPFDAISTFADRIKQALGNA